MDLMLEFNERHIAYPLHIIVDNNWQIVYAFWGKLEGDNMDGFKYTIDKTLQL